MSAKMSVVEYFMKCLLLPVLFVTAWDIAVITKNEIDFFQNKKLIDVAEDHLKELLSGSYDPVLGELYVNDCNQPNASIFKLSTLHFNDQDAVHSIGFQPVVSKQMSIVHGVAFDPVTTTLFWSTGNGHSIRKLEVVHSNEPLSLHSGEILHKFKDEIPHGIAVDSCNQNIYWTNINPQIPSIERSKMDGSQHKIIIRNELFQPLGIVVDNQFKKIYWTNENQGLGYSIERSDLDGLNRETVIEGSHQQPYAISIAYDEIYWTDWVNKYLLSLPKNSSGGVEPNIVKKFNKDPMGIISNTLYLNIDVKECPLLAPLKQKIEKNYVSNVKMFSKMATLTNSPMYADEITKSASTCVNNGSLKNGICECRKGFSGSYCELSSCHNFCFFGSCELDKFGGPYCTCDRGWSGLRCEINSCHGVCLNDGECSLNERNETVCSCEYGYSGNRCEFQANILEELCRIYCEYSRKFVKIRYQSSTTVHEVDNNSMESLSQSSVHVCSCSESPESNNYELNDGDVSDSNQQKLVSKFKNRINVVVTSILGVFCFILTVTVIYLISKVFKLRKRPRIRKRIVVNKPLASIACRPQPTSEQCEITIENCCNMNICETPCFESDFRSSKATFKKSKSEDKKILINSMHSNSSQDEENY